MYISVSSIVWQRAHLLEAHIRAQYADTLHPDTRAEYSREERAEAMAHVERLASLRHERAADTLRDVLAD